MYGETLFECNFKMAKLAILSTQPMLKPSKIMTSARKKIFLEKGMSATQHGIKSVHINKKLIMVILFGVI